MLDARSIALGGVGYGPAAIARLGLWVGEVVEPPAVLPAPTFEYSWGGRAPDITDQAIAVRVRAQGAALASVEPVRESVRPVHAAGSTLATLDVVRETVVPVEAHAATLATVSVRTEQQPIVSTDTAILAALYALRRLH